jgi:GNAT superfamily N-acetyltransferase
MAMIDLPPAMVPDGTYLDWKSQVRQYDKVGAPGLTYEEHVVNVGTGPIITERGIGRGTYSMSIDCLLWRNNKGHLVGILNHYPVDCRDIDGRLLERAGNVNLWVRPDRYRRGIGTRLLAEANRRWPIDWTRQSYTASGRALIARYLSQSEEP